MSPVRRVGLGGQVLSEPEPWTSTGVLDPERECPAIMELPFLNMDIFRRRHGRLRRLHMHLLRSCLRWRLFGASRGWASRGWRRRVLSRVGWQVVRLRRWSWALGLGLGFCPSIGSGLKKNVRTQPDSHTTCSHFFSDLSNDPRDILSFFPFAL